MFALRITPDFTLEVLEPRHAAELFSLTNGNRDHLREWLPWLDRIETMDDTKGFIDNALLHARDGKGFQTVIRVAGTLAGIIGHHTIDWDTRSTSLGYWLARDAQGKGIMTQACAVHLEHAFSELGLDRVEIRCAVRNAKSRAIPERLGFRLEGVVRDAEWLYDHFVDHAVYRLRAREWPGAAGFVTGRKTLT